MINRFRDFIQDNNLCVKGSIVLLAVSGGADSVLMTHLFIKSGYKCGIAHCNFGLRGKESDSDESFVRQLAQDFGIPFYSKLFDTEGMAKSKGISIQMAARELRYKWFEELTIREKFDVIAVATHQTDQLETILINQLRGSGLSGIQGILPVRGAVIRPMLFATADEIRDYCFLQNIEFRSDSSNAEDHYIRNRIRHHVLPVLKKINPSVEATFNNNALHLREINNLYEYFISSARKELLKENAHGFRIDIDELKKFPVRDTLLYELLHPFGYNISQVKNIYASLDGISGKIFETSTHRLFKDRKSLFIRTKNGNQPPVEVIIEQNTDEIKQAVNLRFSKISSSDIPLKSDAGIALLDKDKLQFPMILRKWQDGDVFCPFGMKGSKKISDFLIDCKVPLQEKDHTFVLVSAGQIVWLVGLRIDNRYRVDKETKDIFRIELLKDNETEQTF